MKTKVFILDENGKFVVRKIKREDGKEYILHKGMKAFLKDLPVQQYSSMGSILSFKRRFLIIQTN